MCVAKSFSFLASWLFEGGQVRRMAGVRGPWRKMELRAGTLPGSPGQKTAWFCLPWPWATKWTFHSLWSFGPQSSLSVSCPSLSVRSVCRVSHLFPPPRRPSLSVRLPSFSARISNCSTSSAKKKSKGKDAAAVDCGCVLWKIWIL